MEAQRGWMSAGVTELQLTLDPIVRAYGSEELQRVFDAYYDQGEVLDLAGYRAVMSDRTRMVREWNRFLVDHPIVLTPYLLRPTFAWDRDAQGPEGALDVMGSMIWSLGLNFLGLPAGVVPVSMVEGLPAGVQLVGRRFREDAVLDAMAAIEARNGRLVPDLWARRVGPGGSGAGVASAPWPASFPTAATSRTGASTASSSGRPSAAAAARAFGPSPATTRDTTTMAVEAARNALRARGGIRPDRLLFSTSDPAYLDKTNATAVHAALGLAQDVLAVDLGGAARSAAGALLMAAESSATSVVAIADTRNGMPGGADEATGGDAAAALVFGTGAVLCELVSHAHSSAEFLDRWRTPGGLADGQWEERFGEHEYVPLAKAAVTDALKGAEAGIDSMTHVIVTGVHNRAVGVVRAGLGAAPTAIADDLSSTVGNAGGAIGPIVLCDVLDRAGADEMILQVNLADGVDVFVWRTTSALGAFRDARPAGSASVRAQIEAGGRR